MKKLISTLTAAAVFLGSSLALAAPEVSKTCTASAAADATCEGTVDNVTGFSWHVMVTGNTPNGTLYLQASNDGGTTWENVASVAIAADATQLWNVSGAQYRKTRVFWDRTSGGTTFTAYHWHKEGK